MMSTRTVIRGFLLLALLGSATLLPFAMQAGEDGIEKVTMAASKGPLRCDPSVVYKGESFRLRIPPRHPSGLAIKDPKDNWFYLQDPEGEEKIMADSEFSKLSEFLIDTRSIKGKYWVDGVAKTRLIFQSTGEYLIYMADELETEPENTFSLSTTVYYHASDRR